MSRLEGHLNYLIGDDPKEWRIGLPLYSRLRYEEIYPGIDVIFHSRDGQLEFDVNVGSGARPETVRFEVSSAERVLLRKNGNLVLEKGAGRVILEQPISYQITDGGVRRYVKSAFSVSQNDRVISFDVGSYDRDQPLVIDPVVTYSTYFGGDLGDDGESVAIGDDGSVYMTGDSSSRFFPAAGDGQPQDPDPGPLCCHDGIIAKFGDGGRALDYVTLLGGDEAETGESIASGPDGDAYVTGWTASSDFPTINAFQGKNPRECESTEGNCIIDAFVVRLDDRGNLVYSTYLGGRSWDYGNDIDVDPAGRAFIAGQSASSDYPVRRPLQRKKRGHQDFTISKFSPAGDLRYSTFLGGSGNEWYPSIALDSRERMVLGGETESIDFPLRNPVDRNSEGSEAIVLRVSRAGDELQKSTFWGGSGNDQIHDIAVTRNDAVYVTGLTSSRDLPTRRAFQRKFGGGCCDAFIARLSSRLSRVQLSSYLGGSRYEEAYGVASDAEGRAYVVGTTASPDLPLRRPIQGRLNESECTSSSSNCYDAFASLVGRRGSLLFGTYFGGNRYESGGDVATMRSSLVMVGETQSVDFPTHNAIQPTLSGSSDAFFIKLAFNAI